MTIGRIFQDPTKGTAANMSIEDNMITAETKGMKGLRISLNNEKREQFRSLLKLIDLQDRLKDNVGLLSGGQRQALTLLMTVMSRPKMLLLDEHTAALDPRNAQVVMGLTERFIAEYKLTALMVTHNMQFAINFGNRRYDGRRDHHFGCPRRGKVESYGGRTGQALQESQEQDLCQRRGIADKRVEDQKVLASFACSA